MVAWFTGLNPVVQALIATLFTWSVTALGAAFVFFFKRINRKVLDGMLGFAAGVMIAASYWSLLAPAIEMAEEGNLPAWVPATVGFLMGGFFLWIIDKILPHLHLGFPRQEAEGIKTSWHRSVLLVLAITLHNIPEGLAVGVGFGSGDFGAATSLAIGIGLQNMPEGLAVALPLMGEGYSRWKAVGIATLTGLVEPIGGLLGVGAVTLFEPILPFGLAFAAGAMLFVISDEIIPETHTRGFARLATFGVIVGFLIMMALDNLLD